MPLKIAPWPLNAPWGRGSFALAHRVSQNANWTLWGVPARITKKTRLCGPVPSARLTGSSRAGQSRDGGLRDWPVHRRARPCRSGRGEDRDRRRPATGTASSCSGPEDGWTLRGTHARGRISTLGEVIRAQLRVKKTCPLAIALGGVARRLPTVLAMRSSRGFGRWIGHFRMRQRFAFVSGPWPRPGRAWHPDHAR